VKAARGAERRKQVVRVLEECGLADMARRQMGTLSKGYRQRVGLAQALLCEPEVLILDEPTIGLDPNQLIDMRELIRALAGKTTILLSSHILAEVAHVCHRVVIINKGQILAEDTPDGLRKRLQGATQTRVRVEGPTQDVQNALRALPGVNEVVSEDREAQDPLGQMFVVLSEDRSVIHEIAKTVVNRGWQLQELNPVTVGLEELFVRLTKEEQRPAA
jgi:ABC-2 type transport system ATP-binding protein